MSDGCSLRGKEGDVGLLFGSGSKFLVLENFVLVEIDSFKHLMLNLFRKLRNHWR